MKPSYKFTIFTPVYNRKDKILRVWNSLNNQTFRDFEWIVVDDGSTDGIIDLLNEYKTEASFPVTILTQENKGKHFAWNRAVEIAKGELFVPADSDDEFISETLEFFNDKWEQLTANEKLKIAGINVLCSDPDTKKVIGTIYPKDEMISNNLEMHYKYRITGEKWGCIRTDILQKYPFPEITGRGSYILSYLWFSISKKYKSVYYNTSLRYYFRDTNSITIPDPMLNNEKQIKAAPTRIHYILWHLNSNYRYILKHHPIQFFKYISFLSYQTLLIKRSLYEVKKELNDRNLKVLFQFFVPFSYLRYIIQTNK